MNKIKITLISLILIINYLFLGFIMGHDLYLNGDKQNIVYYNLEPQSTARLDKDPSATPDFVVSTGGYEMLNNAVDYNIFNVYLDGQTGNQTGYYSATRFKNDFLGYNSDNTIKNGYFFPPFPANGADVIDKFEYKNTLMNLNNYSSTLVSGFIVVYINTNDYVLYKEFTNELLPLTYEFTYADAINSLEDKTKVSLSDLEKKKLFTPKVTLSQSAESNTGYSLEFSAETNQSPRDAEYNFVGIKLNSIKQVKLDGYDDYPSTNGGYNLIETPIAGNTTYAEKDYIRLYRLSGAKKEGGDGASECDFSLPLKSLDNGRDIDSANISGFVCLNEVHPETSEVTNRYIYFSGINLKDISSDVYVYGESFYTNNKWALKLIPVGNTIEGWVISDSLVSNLTYITFHVYIYQYGISSSSGAYTA